MKKFLIAIVLFIAGITAYGQECFEVQLTPTVGQCFSDAKLKVTVQPKSPMPSGCTVSGNYLVELVKPTGAPSVQNISGNPATYEFNSLQAGTYTVTVNDAVTGRKVVKKIALTTTYKTMNITDLKVTAPSCNSLIDGQIEFKIPSGGIGPFQITIFNAAGTVLVPAKTYTRPSPATNFISIKGEAGKELRSGKVRVEIKDLANGNPDCGDTQRIPVDIPAAQNTPECFPIKIGAYYFNMGNNCDFNLQFSLNKTTGGLVTDAPYQHTTYFNGKAKIEFLNRAAGPIIPDFEKGIYKVKNYIFKKGDKIRITVVGGVNTITETYELTNNFLTPPSCNAPTNDRGLAVADLSQNACVPGGARLLWEVITSYTSRELTDVVTGTKKTVYVAFHNTEGTFPYNFTVEKLTGGTWNTVPSVTWSGKGTYQEVQRRATADLTASGPGRYRFRYKHPNNCSDICSREFDAQLPNTSNPAKALDDWQFAYGIYENTGTIFRQFIGSDKNISYPVTIRLTPADGRKAISFATRLPFTETATKTIVFPLTLTNPGTINFSGWGDLPAGTYSLSVTDNCGNTATKTIEISMVRKLTDKLKVNSNCNSGYVSYDVGEMYGTTTNLQMILKREISPGVYKAINTPATLSRLPVHTFSNLSPGNYALQLTHLYYQLPNNAIVDGNVKSVLQTKKNTFDVFDHYIEKPFTLEPQASIVPQHSSAACSAASGSGIISVDVTGQQIVYPLTFSLYKKPNLTTPEDTKTFQETDPDNTYTVFRNLQDGHYLVRVKHQCQTVQFDEDVKIDNVSNPIVSLRAAPSCRGDQATLYLSLSDLLFDIRWYQLNSSGQRTTSSPLGTGQVFSNAISETTTFEVEYKLKDNIGCLGTNTLMTKTVTVTLPKDTTPPVISGCPSNITVVADAGKCSKKVSWTEPTATDTCYDATRVTRSHAPNTEFGIGTHTVVYTFSDIYGNTSTCTFNVIVQSRALEMTVTGRFTNSAGVAITQINPNDEFIYEISYRNTGQQPIDTASLTVQLPSNAQIVRNGTPNLSGATQGSSVPSQVYDGTTNTYLFTIPGATLGLGSATRVIKIPMKHTGGCTEAVKPCGNYFSMRYQMNFGGSGAGCNVAPQPTTGVHSMTIDTSGCVRDEVFCSGKVLNLSVAQGFDTYKWYVNGTLQPTYTTYQYTGAGTAGIYKVEKTKICDGVQITSVETINYQAVTNATDPIRSQANNVGVTCPDDNTWTSHFYLCDGKSKTIGVSYVNTTFQWEQWLGHCTPSSPSCPNTDESCWNAMHNSPNFTLNTAGKYRLKVENGNCVNYFYFEVFTTGLGGTVGDVIDQTDFTQGSVKISMSTSGITYNIQIFDAGGVRVKNITTTNNETRVDGLSQGTYTVRVTSPQVPGCELNGNFEIKKLNEMVMKATFKGFKDCNTATFEFKAEGGEAPYRFFLWSIDGVQQHANPAAAIGTTPIARQGVGETSTTKDVPNITQVGEYVFLVADNRNGAFAFSNKVTITPPSPHSFTVSATTEIACATNPNTGYINTIFTEPNQNRTVKLYTLDSNGNRLPNPRTSTGGLFTGLPAGVYEIEIQARVGTNICTYTKKPIEILPTQNPMRGFATVLVDKSCDTNTPKQYKVGVNNLSGGTAPYKYSFDGGATYGSSAIGYMGGSGNVLVEDSKGCTLSLPITISPEAIPSIGVSTITYRCDNGNGVVTLTVTSAASQTYEYSIDGETPQTISGTTVVRELTPGVHSLTLYYRSASNNATSNILFKEDFGTGTNTCMDTGATTGLTCSTNGVLSNGNYVITKQVPSIPAWVTSPVDPTGGRYLAIAGSGGNELVYEKRITGVVLNKALSVDFDVMSLLPTAASGVAPRFNVEIRKSDGTLLYSKLAGTANNGASWTKLSTNFTEAEVAGFTDAQLTIRLINVASNSYNNLGNDYVIDNITIRQQPQICNNSISQLINVASNKQMRIEKYGAEKNVSCYGASDGMVRIRVINPTSNQMRYSIDPLQATWTPVTLDAQGVFTITNLAATQNGVVTVQDAANRACVVSLAGGYKIAEPSVITPTVVITDKATCFNNGKAKIKVSAVGGTPNYRYQVDAAPLTTPSINPVEILNLSVGIHTLVVTDANGCRTETTFEIVAPVTLTATAEPESYCYQLGDVKHVVINVLSGNGNYKVQKQGGTGIYAFSSGSFTYPEEVNAGTHTFTITDGFGCTTTVSTQVYEALSLQVSPTHQQYADCKGGSVTYTLTARGGDVTALKTFRVSTDNGATYTTIGTAVSQIPYSTNATSNTNFKFQVLYHPDGSECKAEQYVTLRSDPPRLLVGTLTVTAATCGLANGALLLSASDYHVGTSSHTVQVLNNLGQVQTMTALAQGSYILKITDDRGCSITKNFTVDGEPQLNATVAVTKPISCNASTAELAVKLISGGKAPYTIKVENITHNTTQSVTLNNQAANTTQQFANLNYGNYNITIVDANGCETHLQTVVNANTTSITVRTNPQSTCSTTNSIFVKAGGTASFTTSTNAYFAVYRTGIQNPPTGSTTPQVAVPNLDGSTTDIWYKGVPSGNGVEAEIKNLIPGVKYTFVVYNVETGCRYTHSSTVPVATKSTLAMSVQPSATTCADASDGTVTFTLSGWQGGTTHITWKVYNNSTHQQVDTGTAATVSAPQATNPVLPAGQYYIVFTESPSNCTNAYHFEVKKSRVQMQVSTAATQKASCNTLGQAWLNITGGTATYTYGYVTSGTAYNPATVSATTQTSKHIALPAGSWDVYVRDAYGCLQSSTVTIGLFDTPSIASVTALSCQAYNNANGNTPVRVTLNQIGQGAHYYSLDGGAEQVIVWTMANQAFEVEVTPLVTHTITVKDVNGCVATATFSTTAIITATATISKLKTCASPTGAIRVSVAGGTGTYSYTLEYIDSGTSAGQVIVQNQSLPAGTSTITIPAPANEGTYKVIIYDAETESCPIEKEVTLPAAIWPTIDNLVVQAYHEKCNLGLTVSGTGSIEVAMPTDSDSYRFTILSATDLTTGLPVPFSATPSASGTHSATFSNLHGTPIGVEYVMQVTANSTGCSVNFTAQITSPEPLELQTGVITTTEYVCEGNKGLSVAKVTVDTSKIRGGIPPYTIEFFDNGGNSLGNGTEYTLPNLNGGTFYAMIKDASGTCATSTASVTVAPAFELQTISITTTRSVTCVQDEEVTINVTVTPTYITGTPLRYTIKGTTNAYVTITTTTATSLSLTGAQALPVGNYSIEVMNERTGCSITGVYKVKDPNTFEMYSSNAIRAICHKDTGSIMLTLVDKDLSDGDQSAGFTYTVTAVSGGATTTGTVSGNTTTLTLVGGSYDIEAISNVTGCKVAKHRFVIPSNPAEIKVTNVSQKVSVDCSGENGVAGLTITGGQQTYTVKLINVLTGSVHSQSNVLEGPPGIQIGGLSSGDYRIEVEDALGCTVATGTLSVTIAPYNGINTASITVATTSITCIDAKDGKLKVSGVSGGARPYHYHLIRTSATGSDLPEIVTTDSEATFTGIEPGTYRVDIYDAQNCSVTVSGSYTFANPLPITADIDETQSKFYTCNGTSNGEVTVHNITGGTGNYIVKIVSANNNRVIDKVQTTGSSHTFMNLSPSDKNSYYQIVIEDSNKCTMTKTLSFTVVEFPDIEVSYVDQEGTCQANTNSYVDYLIVKFRASEVDFSKIQYSFNGNTSSRTSFARTSGNIGYIDNYDRTTHSQTIEIHYTAVSPLTGYCTSTKSFTVNQITPLVLSQVTNTTLNTIEVIATGGVTSTLRGYTYYFNGVSRGDNPVYKLSHNDPERIDNGRRLKIIDVKVEDIEGCTRTMTIEKEYYDIEIPNFFTPNGDGENDKWKPKHLDNNVNARIYIFDRYGRRIATLLPNEGWDGTYDGRPMPSGDYWYILEINDQLYDKREFYGNFTLYRYEQDM